MKNKIKNEQTVEEVFEAWGKGKRELPPHNEVLKNKVLSQLPVEHVPSISFGSPRRSPFFWMPFAFTTLAVVTLLINVSSNPTYTGVVGTTVGINLGTEVSTLSEPTAPPQKPLGGTSVKNEDQGTPSLGMMAPSSLDSYRTNTVMPSTPPYRYKEVPVSDSREFLKINYNATLQTRHVTDTKTRVETIVRGFGGRIDDSSSGETSGYINFVIPKTNFETFKLQIKGLVGEKFYTEVLGSQNFLPEKQMIEANQKQTESNISGYKAKRVVVVKNHNQTVSSYQTNIEALQAQIVALNYEYPSASQSRKIEIENKIRELQGQINVLELYVIQENESYKVEINSLDAKIRNGEASLKSTKTQDQNLLDDVATVNGTITLNQINLWEMADIYVPGPLLTWVFILAAIASYIWYRRTLRV